MNWTTGNIPDLSGKVIIVTGGNSGIGYIAVREFAARGAKLVMACREISRGEEAVRKIHSKYPHADISITKLELSDLSAVNEFAGNFRNSYKKLDILLNNAGIMMAPYSLTKDGFESQFGINHLGHFALTGHLLDLILKTPGSRIVNISSNAHKFGKMDFDNLLFEKGKGYKPLKAYARSKLANVLFTYELQRRLTAAGHSVLSVAAHPGVADTNLGRFIEGKTLVKLLMPVWKMMTQSADMGALPGIRAAVDHGVKPGTYYGPDGPRGSRGYPVEVESNMASHNADDAEKLWERSEQLTKIKYNF